MSERKGFDMGAMVAEMNRQVLLASMMPPASTSTTLPTKETPMTKKKVRTTEPAVMVVECRACDGTGRAR